IITDVFSLLEHQFEVARIKVRRELAEGPIMVRGVEHRLQQVFLNLFLNARDAMPRGGWLTVLTRAEGAKVVAEIADTGAGIPPGRRRRLSAPSFPPKDIGRGTGLGFWIPYGFVQEHEGSIRCDSAVGHGTRLVIALPLAPAIEEVATSGDRPPE